MADHIVGEGLAVLIAQFKAQITQMSAGTVEHPKPVRLKLQTDDLAVRAVRESHLVGQIAQRHGGADVVKILPVVHGKHGRQRQRSAVFPAEEPHVVFHPFGTGLAGVAGRPLSEGIGGEPIALIVGQIQGENGAEIVRAF